MKILRKFSEDPRILTYLGIALALGIVLMLIDGHIFRRDGPATGELEYIEIPEPTNPVSQSSHSSYYYERILEQRLEEVLSLVDGAGNVRVMLTFAQGRETIFAVDRNTNTSDTQEQDAQGGTRYQSNRQNQDNTLIIQDRPLVVKETPPVIGGVMIIAEGGDNVLVQDALIRATSTLLGIDINRVQVLKMK